MASLEFFKDIIIKAYQDIESNKLETKSDVNPQLRDVINEVEDKDKFYYEKIENERSEIKYQELPQYIPETVPDADLKLYDAEPEEGTSVQAFGNYSESKIEVYLPEMTELGLSDILAAITFEPGQLESIKSVPVIKYDITMPSNSCFSKTFVSIDLMLRSLVDSTVLTSEVYNQFEYPMKQLLSGHGIVDQFGTITITSNVTDFLNIPDNGIKYIMEALFNSYSFAYDYVTGKLDISVRDIELRFVNALFGTCATHRIKIGQYEEYQLSKQNLSEWLSMQNVYNYLFKGKMSPLSLSIREFLKLGVVLYSSKIKVEDNDSEFLYPVSQESNHEETITPVSLASRVALAVFGYNVLKDLRLVESLIKIKD